MGYKEFFEKHSINEIVKETYISPSFLNSLVEGDFDKLDKNKFNGFINIIENKYDVDLSDLREEFEEYLNSIKKEDEEVEIKDVIEDIEKENSNNYTFVFIISLILIIVLYFMFRDKKDNHIKVPENNVAFEINDTNVTYEEEKTPVVKEVKNREENDSLIVIPHNKLWFRVFYLDDNSSKEYLTSHKVELNLSRNQYIKFGNGEFTFVTADYNLTPDTKKIVRYLIIDKNISKTKRVKNYEK